MKTLFTIGLLLLFAFDTHAQQKTPAADSTMKCDTTIKSTRGLREVVVSAGAFEASDKAKGAALTPIDAVTVAGSNGDISQALRSLPGAQQIGEQEGLFVRGGTSDETKQFIDGTLLRTPNYPAVPGVPQYARINPFLFKGILFSSGGYSALYGQAMSSALILESVDLPEKTSASFSIFPMNLSAGMQYLAPDNRSSYGAKISYSNLALYNSVVPQKPDFYAGPAYLDGNANFRIRTGKTGMLKFYSNWGYSDVGLNTPDIDSSSLKAGFRVKGWNSYNNLSFRSLLSNNWKIELGAAYSYNKQQNSYLLSDAKGDPVHLPTIPFIYKNGQRIINSNFAQARILLTHFFPRGQALRVGAEQFYTHDQGNANDSAIRFTDHLTAVFAEGDIYLADNLAAKTGLRMEYASALGKAVLAPRISLAYRLHNGGQFNLAYGIFYQEPANDFLYLSRQLEFSSATHYVLNYTRKASNRLFRVEAYYKQYQHLVKTMPALDNNGKGYAQGVELFWRDKKTFKNLDYWVTYTYLDTKRNFLDYPYSLRPSFAAPHTATIAVKKFLPDINTSVNVSWAFATGRPYYHITTNGITDQGTTNAYNMLNLHVAYLCSFFKHSRWKDFSGIAAGINNITGTRQVFGYNYSYNGQIKEAITPPATRSVFIGVFMSLGIDRTEDFLNNDL
ncbi:TonB-dependent receptor plug domain-containing protein [Chitinophaga polysaccharea]|uniref:TonB-dependent receptor plug domain-containing protein n=1 Tax=Chitinophaga polysaccharea TaxID=1293035 RepID=UPI001455CCAA|nr:TonB-dependent receptor plug domain-containing protein [Chitinophaga polysaccharea]NLR58370.1 TonB-dependent receptor plug domain-containing protein [Chitinophaga polysaccharea]